MLPTFGSPTTRRTYLMQASAMMALMGDANNLASEATFRTCAGGGNKATCAMSTWNTDDDAFRARFGARAVLPHTPTAGTRPPHFAVGCKPIKEGCRPDRSEAQGRGLRARSHVGTTNRHDFTWWLSTLCSSWRPLAKRRRSTVLPEGRTAQWHATCTNSTTLKHPPSSGKPRARAGERHHHAMGQTERTRMGCACQEGRVRRGRHGDGNLRRHGGGCCPRSTPDVAGRNLFASWCLPRRQPGSDQCQLDVAHTTERAVACSSQLGSCGVAQ